VGKFQQYWGTVAKRAAKQAAKDMRVDSVAAVAIVIAVQTVVGLGLFFVLGKLTDANFWTRVLSVAAPFVVYPLVFLVRMIVTPVLMDAALRSQLVPGPIAETPLFKVTECWWDQMPTSPPTRQAYAIIEYTRDLKDAQLKVWGYENAVSFLVEAHPAVTQLKGHKHRIPLATVSIHDRAIPNKWGAGGPAFGENSPKLVVIEMMMGDVRQEYRIGLMAMLTGDQCHLSVVTPDNNPYFWPDRVNRQG
jgi:hypothetical protein